MLHREPLSYRQRLNAYIAAQSSATLVYPQEPELHMPYPHEPMYYTSRKPLPNESGPTLVPQAAASSVWANQPPQQQQQQQMQFAGGGGVTPGYSVGATQGYTGSVSPYQPRPMHTPYPRPNHPASGVSHYPSDSGSGYYSGETSVAPRKPTNTFVACAKDCFQSIAIQDAVPVVATICGAVIHHIGNRKSDSFAPYQKPAWVRYVCNAMMIFSGFAFARARGIIGARKDKKQQQAANQASEPNGANGMRGISGPVSSSVVSASRSGRARVPENAAEDIQRLFGVDASRADAEHIIDEYDARWAVPKSAAKRHYYDVYHAKVGLRNANAQTMGGAAAIRALRKETQQQRHQKDCKSARCSGLAKSTVMDSALAEAHYLLQRKAAVARLGPNDTIESVGRIALATIIKMKVGPH
ncbi:hypothetical protein LPJ61_005660 [Coemansia biformis]|uniref:Uncharacterized protein n=1 Tax=Coemansia biformis TaxID=1286918 RepID=A0A9W8CVI7_9FUNG|nr:hypothetical protein LPJ61_005660 [Coemansia biformis]